MSPKGKRIGKVVDVLFAPQSTTVAGFVVQRPRLLYMLDRKDRFLALDSIAIDRAEREFTVSDTRTAFDGVAAKRLGLSWDDTVIWSGMPVRTKSGGKLGAVRDGLFDEKTGELVGLGLTGGVTADLAVGVRDIAAARVIEFDGEAVVVTDEVAQIETTGGAAAAAGKGAAVAAKTAGDAAKTAAMYGKAAAKVAADSEAGKKAMGWLKAIKDEVVDAMGDPDDD